MKKLIIHKHIVAILNILPELQRGKCLGLLIEYNETGILPTASDDDIAPAMQSINETLRYIENISKIRSNAGKKGGNPILVNQNENLVKQNSILVNQNTSKPNILVNQNENSDNIYNINNNNDNNINILNNNNKEKAKKEKPLEERKQEFYDSLVPFVEEFGKVMVRDFFDYWTETNKSGKKMRFEDQRFFSLKRRLVTWRKNNEEKYNTNGNNTRNQQRSLDDRAAEIVSVYLSGSNDVEALSDLY